MVFDDMRQFISRVESLGEAKVLKGADWDLEIGLISEWQSEVANSPLLMFDNIKGYPAGYRVVTNLFTSMRRTTLALGLPAEMTRMQLVKALRDKLSQDFKMLPPVEVATAPVKENVHLGGDIDLFEFPTPKWHSLDGGRFIGTASGVIMKDPDGGWVNVGTYRVQVLGKSSAGLFMKPGSHGTLIMNKWWAKGLSCPVAVATGMDPIMYMAGYTEIEHGVSEYDFAGGFRGKPVPVIRGVTVDLPVPATAEIVLEGHLTGGDMEEEGPFGEYTGYYAGGRAPRPVIRVSAVLHRNNPIIHGAPHFMIPSATALAFTEMRSATIWNQLDKIIPGIKGVCQPDYAPVRPTIVAVEQLYDGHAKQVAMALNSIRACSIANSMVIVVDDDIDPSNMAEVVWAMSTRCDPATSVDIVRGLRSSPLHPVIDPEKRQRGDFTSSCALILACRPYAWRDQFPPTIRSDPKELDKIREKWGRLLT